MPFREIHYNQKYVALLTIFAISPVTNARALVRGRAAFVYHESSVDRIGRTVGVLTARYFRAAVIDQILVDNDEFLPRDAYA